MEFGQPVASRRSLVRRYSLFGEIGYADTCRVRWPSVWLASSHLDFSTIRWPYRKRWPMLHFSWSHVDKDTGISAVIASGLENAEFHHLFEILSLTFLVLNPYTIFMSIHGRVLGGLTRFVFRLALNNGRNGCIWFDRLIDYFFYISSLVYVLQLSHLCKFWQSVNEKFDLSSWCISACTN